MTLLTHVVRTLAAALSKWKARTLRMPSVMRVSTYLGRGARGSGWAGLQSRDQEEAGLGAVRGDSHLTALEGDN